MKYLLLLLLCTQALATEAVQLQEVELRYQKYVGTVRDPLFSASTPSEGWQLGTSLGLLGVAGVDAAIVAGTDQAQFHFGGLQYFAYVRVVPQLQVGWAHQSLHMFDTEASGQGFPLYNAIEVRVKLFNRDQAKQSLF